MRLRLLAAVILAAAQCRAAAYVYVKTNNLALSKEQYGWTLGQWYQPTLTHYLTSDGSTLFNATGYAATFHWKTNNATTATMSVTGTIYTNYCVFTLPSNTLSVVGNLFESYIVLTLNSVPKYRIRGAVSIMDTPELDGGLAKAATTPITASAYGPWTGDFSSWPFVTASNFSTRPVGTIIAKSGTNRWFGIAPGGYGQWLQSAGTNSVPAWITAPGGGNVNTNTSNWYASNTTQNMDKVRANSVKVGGNEVSTNPASMFATAGHGHTATNNLVTIAQLGSATNTAVVGALAQVTALAYLTAANTQGLATVTYVNTATNGAVRAATNSVAQIGYLLPGSTQGLASVVWVQSETNAAVVASLARVAALGYLLPANTQGLATVSWIQSATNALYRDTTNSVAGVGYLLPSSTQSLASLTYIISQTNATVLAALSRVSGVGYLLPASTQNLASLTVLYASTNLAVRAATNLVGGVGYLLPASTNAVWRDAQYVNALLRDGSRSMLEYLNAGGYGISNVNYLIVNEDGGIAVNGFDLRLSVDTNKPSPYDYEGNLYQDWYVGSSLTAPSYYAATGGVPRMGRSVTYAGTNLFASGLMAATSNEFFRTLESALWFTKQTNSNLRSGRMWYSDSNGQRQELPPGVVGSALLFGSAGIPAWGAVTATATNIYLSSIIDTATNTYMLVGNGTDFVQYSPARVRTNLSLVVGVNVQAYDADLSLLATGATGLMSVVRANDGAGSLLDADKLDGYSSGSFMALNPLGYYNVGAYDLENVGDIELDGLFSSHSVYVPDDSGSLYVYVGENGNIDRASLTMLGAGQVWLTATNNMYLNMRGTNLVQMTPGVVDMTNATTVRLPAGTYIGGAPYVPPSGFATNAGGAGSGLYAMSNGQWTAFTPGAGGGAATNATLLRANGTNFTGTLTADPVTLTVTNGVLTVKGGTGSGISASTATNIAVAVVAPYTNGAAKGVTALQAEADTLTTVAARGDFAGTETITPLRVASRSYGPNAGLGAGGTTWIAVGQNAGAYATGATWSAIGYAAGHATTGDVWSTAGNYCLRNAMVTNAWAGGLWSGQNARGSSVGFWDVHGGSLGADYDPVNDAIYFLAGQLRLGRTGSYAVGTNQLRGAWTYNGESLLTTATDGGATGIVFGTANYYNPTNRIQTLRTNELAGSTGGVTDHGALTGLDDTADHPWAARTNDTRAIDWSGASSVKLPAGATVGGNTPLTNAAQFATAEQGARADLAVTNNQTGVTLTGRFNGALVYTNYFDTYGTNRPIANSGTVKMDLGAVTTADDDSVLSAANDTFTISAENALVTIAGISICGGDATPSGKFLLYLYRNNAAFMTVGGAPQGVVDATSAIAAVFRNSSSTNTYDLRMFQDTGATESAYVRVESFSVLKR